MCQNTVVVLGYLSLSEHLLPEADISKQSQLSQSHVCSGSWGFGEYPKKRQSARHIFPYATSRLMLQITFTAQQRNHVSLDSALRVEESVAAGIPLNLPHIVLLRIKVLPETRRVDVLVALIPPPVDHLGQDRVIVGALQRRDVRHPRRGFGLRGCGREWIGGFLLVGSGGSALCYCCFGGVVEDPGTFRAQRLVYSKEVEVIVLSE
jgi:hypothetical protein